MPLRHPSTRVPGVGEPGLARAPIACALWALAVLAIAAPVQALDPEKELHEFALRSWGSAQGLPQMSVEALAATRDGYLWVGTQEGLVRFNGFSFNLFDRASGDPRAPHHVTALLERREGPLAVGSFGGAVARTPRGYAEIPGLEVFANEKVLALAETPSGTLWLGTTAGAASLADGRLTRFGTAQGLPSALVRAIAIDPVGRVWIGTDGGLVRVVAGRVEPVEGLPGVQVLALLADPQGAVWVGTPLGLARWQDDRITLYTAREGLPHPVVGALHLDAQGALWVGTGRGLARLWNGHWSTLATREPIGNVEVTAFVDDHDGTLWVGTASGGLAALVEGRVRVIETDHGLSAPVVYTLGAGAAGSLLAGTESGAVDRIDPLSFRTANLVRPDQTENSRVRTLLTDASGAVWIGAELGLYRLAAGRLRKVDLPGLPRDSFRTSAATRSGDLWFGTERAGVVRIRGRELLVLDAASGLPGNEVRAVLEDPSGDIWIGAHGGLVRWNEGIRQVLRRSDGLAHDFVRCLHLDSRGALWVGTYGGGVSRIADGRILSIGTGQGLTSDAVYAIVEDAGGDLWMSSNRGIFRLLRSEIEELAAGRRGRLQVLHLDQEDGMASAECNGGSPGAWKAPDGRIFFPTLQGVVVVDPGRLGQPASAPPAVIDAVSADGQPFDPSEPAVLAPGTERLEIRYSAISLRASRRLRFWQILEGFDRAWAEGSPGRTAQYTRLPPGRYTFHVAACSGELPCREATASFAFELQPRLYQRAWFAPLASLLALGTLALLWRWRMGRAQARERELQRRIQEALAEIKVLSGLIPICAGCKKIRDDSGYWTAVEDYFHRFSDLKFSHGLCADCVRSLYPEYADSVLGETQGAPAPAETPAPPSAKAPERLSGGHPEPGREPEP